MAEKWPSLKANGSYIMVADGEHAGATIANCKTAFGKDTEMRCTDIAARLVAISNAHDALVEACRDTMEHLETYQQDDAHHLTVELVAELMDQLRSALAEVGR